MLLMLASFVAFFNACRGGDGDQTVATLHGKLITGTPPVIIDVRNPDELRGSLGVLDGALNIPLPDLERRIHELDRYKDRELFVICRSGNRSAKAVKLLRAKGLAAVSVGGGMMAWRDAFGAVNK